MSNYSAARAAYVTNGGIIRPEESDRKHAC